MGELIEFHCNGDRYHGYLAKSSNGKGPGVIVLQEWWGLVGHITDVANRFAAAGFTALAPDLYGGKKTKEPDEAGSLMMALNIGETAKILDCAVSRLQEEESVSSEKVGVVGFCMGGQLSLFAATLNENIGACVDFYGIHPNDHPDLSRLNGPLLGFFADRDTYASPEVVQALDEELTKLGKPHEFKTYPNTDHAFFNNDRPEVYSPQAAEDAWNRMVAFFREHLT